MQIKSENLVEHTGRLYYYDLLRSLLVVLDMEHITIL